MGFLNTPVTKFLLLNLEPANPLVFLITVNGSGQTSESILALGFLPFFFFLWLLWVQSLLVFVAVPLGLAALQHAVCYFPWIRDQTQVSCIERQILNHCSTREVHVLWLFLCSPTFPPTPPISNLSANPMDTTLNIQRLNFSPHSLGSHFSPRLHRLHLA